MNETDNAYWTGFIDAEGAIGLTKKKNPKHTRSIVLSVLLCSSLVLLAGASTIWSQTYGGSGTDYAYSVVTTSDGGYALAGVTDSFGAGKSDFWLVKTDAFGNMEWNKTYGGTSTDYAYSLVGTSDGGYALGGQTSSLGAGSSDSWLVKTDALGNMQWNKTYGKGSVNSLVATSDGGYTLAGGSLLVKTDALGNVQWNKTYGEGGFRSLIATSDGGYALAGSMFVKTDALGNMEWRNAYGGTAYSLVETPDGGYAIAGTISWESPITGTSSAAWLVKTDSNGVVEWNQTVGEAWKTWNSAHSLVAAADGGYIMAGFSSSDSLLVKIDSNGVMEWTQTYGRKGTDGAWSLVATSDGGYAMAGIATSFDEKSFDFYLVKTDELGFSPTPTDFSGLIPLLLVTAASLAAVAILLILIKRKKLLRKRSFEEADV
jgi:hypothetical protein